MFDNLHDQSGPGWTLHHAECVERMRTMADNSVDAILTDPPYHLTSIKARYGNTAIDRDGTNETRARNRSDGLARLASGFMGKTWDGGDVAFRVETWQAAYRVLKPGGYIMAFASSRGYHRMACAIEDAGFIVHPLIGWVFGNGFPKATDASKMIDQMMGTDSHVASEKRTGSSGTLGGNGIYNGLNGKEDVRRQYSPATPEAAAWNGWYYGGQARKPALEPICVAQKPFSEKNGALNILKWGVGAVNIDGCRIEAGEDHAANCARNNVSGIWREHGSVEGVRTKASPFGRWPANLIHDGSPEVLALFPVLKARSNRNDSAGQARKPALEPICVAQKPFSEKNGALNILKWGVGAVNIDGCRVESADKPVRWETPRGGIWRTDATASAQLQQSELGRWPANLIHDGSPEVLALFPAAPGQIARAKTDGKKTVNVYGDMSHVEHEPRNDSGSAARFFECYPPVITYCPKANARDRLGSRHPTVKPMALMRSFVRHVCPPGGVVLDPFAGTGTTLRAAVLEDRRAIGIEADAASVVDTVWRMRHAQPE